MTTLNIMARGRVQRLQHLRAQLHAMGTRSRARHLCNDCIDPQRCVDLGVCYRSYATPNPDEDEILAAL